jgi:hypothetical protein
MGFPDEQKKDIYDKCMDENKEKDRYCIIKHFYSQRLLS